MHVLYIHQYFKTPEEPGGTRSYWIAKELIKQGHEVTMVTSRNEMSSKVKKTTIDGINVIYIRVPYSQEMGILKRIFSFFHFMLLATWHAYKIKNVNIVYATSTPLTIGFPALILKKLKSLPYIFEVRDLWPEVPIQMGGLNNKLLIKISIGFEKLIYKNAQHVIALSPGMSEGVIKRGVPAHRVSMIPNMAKIDEFWPREKNKRLMLELGLKAESFKLVHFGALGKANGVKTILESAKLLKDNAMVEFIFIGGGSVEEELKLFCRGNNMNNVYFLGKFPLNETSEIVNFCDVSIVSFLDIPILYTNSPNKLFDSLSAGKPIIVNSAGWTKEMVEENKCGFYINPNRPTDLVEKTQFLLQNPEVVRDFGRESRRLAETKYDKNILCKEVLQVMETLDLRK